MDSFLIKFVISRAGKEKKKQVFLPNKDKGGLPQTFLIQIPFFGALMANSFKDSLKSNPEVNQFDLTSLNLSIQDVISYLIHRKAFSAEEEKNSDLIKPTTGVLRLAHFFQDRELMIHFAHQYQFDYQTYLEFDEVLLSELAGEYLSQIFSKKPNHKNLLNSIRMKWSKFEFDWENDKSETKTKILPILNKLKELKSEVIKLSKMLDQSQKWKGNYSSFHSIVYCDDCQLIEGDQLSDYIEYYLDLIDQSIEKFEFDVEDIRFEAFDNRFRSLGRIYSFVDRHLVHYFAQNKETWSSKIRRFVNLNPGMAKLIWETEEFRSDLLRTYLKISNRKYRRFFESMFEDVIPLVENRIGPNAPNINQELTKILRQDSRLAALYDKYSRNEEATNSLYSYYISSEDNEGLEITWNQIIERKKYLIDRYNANRQKNAPRGPIKASWYL